MADGIALESTDINALFPHQVCINLDRRPDRWQRSQQEFARYDVHYVQRFSALDGRDLVLPSHWQESGGAYGCLQSHLEVVRDARQRGLPNILIFEDDVELDPRFQDKFARYITDLPSDWDMLFLGAFHKDEPTQVSQHVYRVSQAHSTFAYALNHTLFDQFIDSNEAAKVPVDDNNLALQKTAKCFCFMPGLVWVKPTYSDAQGRFANHWYLRESLVLPGHSISRFVENSIVIIAYNNPSGLRSLNRNLICLSKIYRTRSQGLAVSIVEQGSKPTVAPGTLPNGCGYTFLRSDQSFDRGMCFNTGAQNADASKDVFVFIDADVYLENRDIRGNIAMCHKYGCTTGFDRIFELTSDDTNRFLRDESQALTWFNPDAYPMKRKVRDFSGCCFCSASVFQEMGGWSEAQPTELKFSANAVNGHRLNPFMSPNSALRLSEKPSRSHIAIAD